MNLTFVCFLTFTSMCLAQMSPEDRQRADRERKEDAEKLRRLENQPMSLPQTARFYRKLTREQKDQLTPSKEDFLKHKLFLRSPKTGIVKILPDPKCNVAIINSADPKCVRALPISGMGSRYSFIKETHADLLRSDISFSDNYFTVGFKPNLSGVIVDLGDSEINLISSESEEIKVLKGIVPATSYSGIQMQKQQLEKGFESGGKRFATKISAKINNTYALRSINYYKALRFKSVDLYDDILLVFRVVNVDSEGAVTLIWKEIKRNYNVRMAG